MTMSRAKRGATARCPIHDCLCGQRARSRKRRSSCHNLTSLIHAIARCVFAGARQHRSRGPVKCPLTHPRRRRGSFARHACGQATRKRLWPRIKGSHCPVRRQAQQCPQEFQHVLSLTLCGLNHRHQRPHPLGAGTRAAAKADFPQDHQGTQGLPRHVVGRRNIRVSQERQPLVVVSPQTLLQSLSSLRVDRHLFQSIQLLAQPGRLLVFLRPRTGLPFTMPMATTLRPTFHRLEKDSRRACLLRHTAVPLPHPATTSRAATFFVPVG